MKTVAVLIQHTDREPWQSIQTHNLEDGWLSQTLPDGVEAVIFDALQTARPGERLDRLHEKLRWNPRSRGWLYRLDRALAKGSGEKIPSWRISGVLRPGLVTIQASVAETLRLTIQKQLAAFDYFLRSTSADYAFSTNTANYVHVRRLKSVVQRAPERRCYAGSVLKFGGPFVSGANRLMSRDVVELIVANTPQLDFGLLEDVAFGRLVEEKGILPTILPTLNIQNADELRLVPDSTLDSYHQIRVKSLVNRAKNDVAILRSIHHRMSNNGF